MRKAKIIITSTVECISKSLPELRKRTKMPQTWRPSSCGESFCPSSLLLPHHRHRSRVWRTSDLPEHRRRQLRMRRFPPEALARPWRWNRPRLPLAASCWHRFRRRCQPHSLRKRWGCCDGTSDGSHQARSTTQFSPWVQAPDVRNFVSATKRSNKSGFLGGAFS